MRIMQIKKYLFSGLLATSIVTLMLFTSATYAGLNNLHDNFNNVSAEELSELVSSDSAIVFDVNTNSYRAYKGIIPGAKLLRSYRYDAEQVLPADKSEKLVFYCANTLCTSAPMAAQIAVDAGYQDVNVLLIGIDGWLKAGFQSEIF